MNNARIRGGKAFYAENRAALDDIAARTGVPAEYIGAIIGVETSYGRITGSYRVLDALYTLAFSHPRRAPFFAGELAQLFALAQEEPQLDILALKGSYAGAMGMRSEEQTSELQSLMRNSYAVFCWKKKKTHPELDN